MKSIIEVGSNFNKLTAVRFSYRDKWSTQYWLFKCDCGNKKVIRIDGVKKGRIKSCGCYQKECGRKLGMKKVHGMTKTRTYKSWLSMRQRCLNKNDGRYEYYGGRGVIICDRWIGKNDFENFYRDMGERPKNKTLDRIDNNGNYCKENCKWSTKKEQANNRRSNCSITYKGKTQNIKQWEEELNMNNGFIRSKLNLGWNIDKIFIEVFSV